jgi:cytochrome P450
MSDRAHLAGVESAGPAEYPDPGTAPSHAYGASSEPRCPVTGAAGPRTPPHFPFLPGPFGGEPREYAERRAQCPFDRVTMRDGNEAILALRYADVSAALDDPRFSRVLTAPESPRWTRAGNIFTDPISFVNREGEDHMRQRRVLASALSAGRIDSWRPMIEQTARELLDGAAGAGDGVDLMKALFTPFPVLIMCRLLGIPPEDYDWRWSDAYMSAIPVTEEQRNAALDEFGNYIVELVARKRHEAATGDARHEQLSEITGRLIAAMDEGVLSEQEMIYILLSVIAAGTDTVTNSFSRIVLMLLVDDRRLWEQVAAAGEITRPVIDELLRRFQQGNGAMLRVAREDVDLPSGRVLAGETVALPLSSAHLDEDVFPDPYALRFDRGGPRALVFGGGAHYCLGVNLAKAELQIGLTALMRTFPNLHLTVDPHRLRYSKGELLTVIRKFPVAW